MKAIEVFSAEQKIVMSSAFEKKARKFGSTEYKMLQDARRDNPGYTEEIRKFKKKPKQEHYAGLTYNFMRWYIARVESKEDAPAVLAGLEYLINISKCHSPGYRYQTVKAWFLDRYPEIEQFGSDNKLLKQWCESKIAAYSDDSNKDSTEDSNQDPPEDSNDDSASCEQEAAA